LCGNDKKRNSEKEIPKSSTIDANIYGFHKGLLNFS